METRGNAEPKTGNSRRVIFIALGSRGDVQPLAVLASELAARSASPSSGEDLSLDVVFMSHSELEPMLRSGAAASILRHGVTFRGLPMPCFLRPLAGDVGHREGDGARFGQDALQALPCVLDLGGQRRAEWVAAAVGARDADVLVGNLFALAIVFHLAERLDVPWLIASPSLVPYAAPCDFAQAFAGEFPELHAALLQGGVPGWTWQDIESWLWPLFTENHALLREELLGLPPVPGYDGKDRLQPQSLRHGRFLLGLPEVLLKGRRACKHCLLALAFAVLGYRAERSSMVYCPLPWRSIFTNATLLDVLLSTLVSEAWAQRALSRMVLVS